MWTSFSFSKHNTPKKLQQTHDFFEQTKKCERRKIQDFFVWYDDVKEEVEDEVENSWKKKWKLKIYEDDGISFFTSAWGSWLNEWEE